jgi:hypothetical protein
MMKERIRELIKTTPFTPFVIHTANGNAVSVPHPDFILAASDGPDVIVEEPNGRVHIINVMLITSLEKGASPQAV